MIKALTCVSGGRRVALDVVVILGVERPRHWARLPGAPSFVGGVIDMRKHAVAVIDLAARLGLRETGRAPEGPVILLESEEPVAIAVDFVSDVVSIDPETLRIPPGSSAAGLQGVSPDGLLLLDAEAIVDGRPLRPLPDVVAEAAGGYPDREKEVTEDA